MAEWHHWLDGRESERTPGVGDGQGGLACCNSWGRKESDMTEWLNWTELNCVLISFQEKPQNKLEATQPGTESTILLGGVPHWTHWPQLSTDVRTHTTDPELGWDCFHYFSWQMGVITGIHATFAKCILHCFTLCHHTLSQSQYVVT